MKKILMPGKIPTPVFLLGLSQGRRSLVGCVYGVAEYASELWCWSRLLRVPWTARRSKQSILKEINPEYSLEGLMLKLKLQYFGHLVQRANFIGKDPHAGKD